MKQNGGIIDPANAFVQQASDQSRFSLISRPIKHTNVKPDYLSIVCLTPPTIKFSLSLSLNVTTNVNRNYPKVAGMLLRYFLRRGWYSPYSRDFYDFYTCIYIRFIRLLTEQGMNEMQMHIKKIL